MVMDRPKLSSGQSVLVTLIQVQAGPETNKKNQPLLQWSKDATAYAGSTRYTGSGFCLNLSA